MNVTVAIKLTAHKNPCYICRKEITKGDIRMLIRSIGYHQQESLYVHPRCLVDWTEREIALIASGAELIKVKINPSRRDQ